MSEALRLFEPDSTEITEVLTDALKPKWDGTRHHFACLNRHINASETPCSDRCVAASDMVKRLTQKKDEMSHE